MESNERAVREEAWKSVTERRVVDSERLSEIFDELISIRHKMAKNAGFQSYTDYMFGLCTDLTTQKKTALSSMTR